MNTKIFKKAVKAYHEFMADNGGYIYCDPVEAMSEIDDEYVYLVNHSGVLGKYEIATGKITV